MPQPQPQPDLHLYGDSAPRPVASHEPASAIREIGGHLYVLKVWTAEKWARTPESGRPDQAQRIGSGWFDLQPLPRGVRRGLK